SPRMADPAPPFSAPAPSGASPKGNRGAGGRVGLPDPTTLLRWLLVGRTVLAVTALVQASVARVRAPDLAFLALIVVFLALAVTSYGAYVIEVRRERPALAFLQVQAAMDLLLVTSLVHFAGNRQGGWGALYVLVVAMYALLMPLRASLVMAVFGSALFLADAMWSQPEGPAPGLWGQVAVFTIVFVVVAILGQRLRTAGEEHTELQTELRQVQLEADEI